MENTLNRNSRSTLNILLYHQVGDTPNSYTNLDCFCDVRAFYEQMEFLATSEYKVISLANALHLISGREYMDGNYVVLTFDDGCEGFYFNVLPILTRFGLASTIYPVARYLGEYALWKSAKNAAVKIISRSMLSELHALGVEIGAHSLDHPKLTQIDRRLALSQIQHSKDVLEQVVGTGVKSFSYPHGDYNSEIIEFVKQSGFTNAVTCISSDAYNARSFYEIPRKYVTFFDTLTTFRQKLN